MAWLVDRVTSALTPVPAETREAIAAGPRDTETHAHWLAELACLREVEVSHPRSSVSGTTPVSATVPARVVAWNVERGRDVPSLARVIRAEASQLVLLTEMDVGMARSGNVHTPRALAEELGFGWVYGVEFLELGLGGPDERMACKGRVNEAGFHGGAILSASPLDRPVVLRLEADGRWFTHPEREEPRVGGRIAVMATWDLEGTPVTVASVHLESHSDTALRASQTATLLEAVERYAPGQPALVAGDLNTFSLGLEDLSVHERLRCALEEDRARLLHPVPYETLFEAADDRGFSWEDCNEMRMSTHRVQAPEPSARGGLKLDWFLARGLTCSDSRVLEAVHPGTGRALSDHEPIAVTCAL